ncbi:MAG: gfo/Idh/MocA family oxidoreductase, partial [Verrucomicrobia bacterium]|nr:gfo/Idh/MocA family oxidoreductase [Verrucomicrobiota bacterium]
DQETFTDTNPVGKIENLHRNFLDCIRSGDTPHGHVELAVKVNTVLGLAEMSERMNLALLFDPDTRMITTGEGRQVAPLTYDTLLG